MKNMTLTLAIKRIGSGAEVARRMNVTRATVAYWIRTGHVPANRAQEFSHLTKLPLSIVNPKVYTQVSQ